MNRTAMAVAALTIAAAGLPATASAQNERSIPSAGKSPNAAIGGPIMPPVVFARTIHAAARVSPTTWRLSAVPMNVKSTPESNAVGNVRAHANHRTRYHSAAHGPPVRDRNAP